MNQRTNYRRSLLACLVLVACSLVTAQGAISEAGVAAAATEDSVLLRWLLPGQTYPAGGFVITREGGGAATESALPAPLPREQAVGTGLVTAEEYDFLASVFDPSGVSGGNSSSSSDSGAEFARAIATLTTVSRPNFARATGTLYEDTAVQEGVSYTYTVRTAGGTLVGSAQVIGGDVKELQAVDDLRGAVEDHVSEDPAVSTDGRAVALRWARPADETLLAAFNVYRLTDDGAVLLNADPLVLPVAEETSEGSDAAFYVDPNVQIGGTYSYRVEGIDLFGRVAPLSEPVSIHVPDPRPLAIPQIIDGEAGDLSITIRWAPPEDARAKAVAVRRRTDPEGNATLTERVLPLSATSYTDENVTGGVMYYYTLVSVDASGRVSEESAIWAEQGYNPTPPSAPTGLRATPQPDGVTLTWVAPPETDVGSYRIYLSRQTSAGTEEFRFEAATVEPNYHLEMLPGILTEVQVLVRAVNTSDVEGPVSNVVRGAALDLVAPPTPRLVEAVGAQGHVTVTWAGTANPDVHALDLFRSTSGGAYELVQENLAPNDLTWVDDNVQPGVEYSYQLEAVDASGNRSDRSDAVTARALDLEQPAPVSGVTAEVSEGGVRIAWQSENGLTYVVQRARAGNVSFVEISGALTGDEYVDARGQAGDVYRVLAVSPSGLVGQPSATATAR